MTYSFVIVNAKGTSDVFMSDERWIAIYEVMENDGSVYRIMRQILKPSMDNWQLYTQKFNCIMLAGVLEASDIESCYYSECIEKKISYVHKGYHVQYYNLISKTQIKPPHPINNQINELNNKLAQSNQANATLSNEVAELKLQLTQL